MKLDKKGFTFVEILAAIVIIGILMSIAIVGVSRYKDKAKNKDYEALAKSSYSAMEEYVMTHPYEDKASLETLVDNNLLSNRQDPGSPDNECTGYVEIDGTAGGSGKLDSGKYTVYLCCASYRKKYTYPDGTVEDYTGTDRCSLPDVGPTIPPGETAYTITYVLNGGSVSGNPSKYSTSTLPITLKNPTRSGYTFDGWTGTGLSGKTKNVVITNGSTGNRTYTANWTKNSETTYTITYVLNGGSVSGNPSKYSASTLPITLKNPTRSGYTFTGWTGTGLTSASKSVTIKKNSTGNRKYTANWTKNTNPSSTYVVTLNNNGATTAGTNSVQVSVGKSSLPKIINPKKEVKITYVNKESATVTGGDKSKAYTLNGWYTARTGGKKVANNSTTPALQKNVSGYTDKNGKWSKKGNTTLYAQWAPVTATLPKLKKLGYECKWTTVDGGNTKEIASGGTWKFSSANSRTFTASCSVKYPYINDSGGEFDTLQKALNNTPKGGKIKLIKKNYRDSHSAVLKRDVTLTLDINGSKLYLTKDNIEVKNGTLKLVNGTIDTTEKEKSAIYCNGGNVIINSDMTLHSSYLANKILGMYAVYIKAGKVTLNGGTISAGEGKASGYAKSVHLVGGTFEMNGGTIYSSATNDSGHGGCGINNSGGKVIIKSGSKIKVHKGGKHLGVIAANGGTTKILSGSTVEIDGHVDSGKSPAIIYAGEGKVCYETGVTINNKNSGASKKVHLKKGQPSSHLVKKDKGGCKNYSF